MVDIVVALTTAMGIARQIKDAVELAHNAELKMKFADLLDSLAEAKIAVADLKGENAELKEKIQELLKREDDEVALNEDGLYYRKKDGSGPFCVKCHGEQKGLVRVEIDDDDGWGDQPREYFSRCCSCGKPYKARVHPK